jgi:DNA-binding transcriptional regulator PaaX
VLSISSRRTYVITCWDIFLNESDYRSFLEEFIQTGVLSRHSQLENMVVALVL